MNKKTDIYLKDEGDFFTVILMTNKARKVKESSEEWNGNKLNLLKSKENSNNIVSWAISHGLSINSELDIIV